MHKLRSLSDFAEQPKKILLKFLFANASFLEFSLTAEPTRIDFPKDLLAQPVDVKVQASFPDGSQSSVPARLHRVWGANIQQYSSSHAFVGLQHDADGTCTVACPTTGEKITGTHPCIKCPTPEGDILEICC
jgi:hypothetical protein